MAYNIKIVVENIERNFIVDEDEIINKDWNEVLESMKDTVDFKNN